MNVYAISDLHLPGGYKKSMDVFGPHWADHFTKITLDWKAHVKDNDIVLLPGDISWAMQLSEAKQDLDAIGALPGHKVLLRGNHDYWWGSITRLRETLPEGMYALQNDALMIGDVVICGSRGWVCPGALPLSEEDARIYTREILRLTLSLQNAEKKWQGKDAWRIAMLHYPPFIDRAYMTDVVSLLEAYGIMDVVYGHLHGPGLVNAFSGEHNGIQYHQVSCDGLGFVLHKLNAPASLK